MPKTTPYLISRIGVGPQAMVWWRPSKLATAIIGEVPGQTAPTRVTPSPPRFTGLHTVGQFTKGWLVMLGSVLAFIEMKFRRSFSIIPPPLLGIRCIVFFMDIKEHKLRENYTKIGQDYSWKIDMTKYRSLQKIQNTIKSLEKLYKQVLQRIRPNILNFF
jgi:hypothetical protein